MKEFFKSIFLILTTYLLLFPDYSLYPQTKNDVYVGNEFWFGIPLCLFGLNISGLPASTYLVTVSGDSIIRNFKLVKR